MKKLKFIVPIALLSASVACGISCNRPVMALAEGEEETTSQVVEVSTEEEVIATEAKEEWDWKEWLSGWISPQTLTTLIALAGALASVLKMASSIKELSGKNQLTIKNIIEALHKELPEEAKEVLAPYMDKIIQSEETIVKVMEVFAKVLALSQDNSPEARIAILNAIQELGMVQNSVIEEAKKAIEDKVASEKKKEEEKEKTVSEVAEDTAKYDGTSI